MTVGILCAPPDPMEGGDAVVYRKLRAVGESEVSSWLGTSNEYDPDKLYVESRDRDKESATLYTKIPGHVMAELERLLAGGQLSGTPLQTKHDIVRDALVHEMHKLVDMVHDQRFAKAAETARQDAQADTMRRIYARYREIPQRVREMFLEAQGDGSVEMADELVGIYEPMIDSIPEPFAGKLEAELKQVRTWLSRNRK